MVTPGSLQTEKYRRSIKIQFKLYLNFLLAKSSFERFKFQPHLSKEVSNKISPAFTLTEGIVCANKIYSLLFKQLHPADEKLRKIKPVVRQVKKKNESLEEKSQSENTMQSSESYPLDFHRAKATLIDCLTETKTVDEHFVEMENSVEKLFTSLKIFLRKQLTFYAMEKEFPMLSPMLTEGKIKNFKRSKNVSKLNRTRKN